VGITETPPSGKSEQKRVKNLTEHCASKPVVGLLAFFASGEWDSELFTG